MFYLTERNWQLASAHQLRLMYFPLYFRPFELKIARSEY